MILSRPFNFVLSPIEKIPHRNNSQFHSGEDSEIEKGLGFVFASLNAATASILRSEGPDLFRVDSGLSGWYFLKKRECGFINK